MKYNEAISLIVDASKFKMQLNAHKGDIEMIPLETAINLARDELNELWRAALNEDHEKVIVECGDTLNFLISIAYNAAEAYRRRKVEQPTPRT